MIYAICIWILSGKDFMYSQGTILVKSVDLCCSFRYLLRCMMEPCEPFHVHNTVSVGMIFKCDGTDQPKIYHQITDKQLRDIM